MYRLIGMTHAVADKNDYTISFDHNAKLVYTIIHLSLRIVPVYNLMDIQNYVHYLYRGLHIHRVLREKMFKWFILYIH